MGPKCCEAQQFRFLFEDFRWLKKFLFIVRSQQLGVPEANITRFKTKDLSRSDSNRKWSLWRSMGEIKPLSCISAVDALKKAPDNNNLRVKYWSLTQED